MTEESPRIVRYDPHDIEIETTEGKKTAALICPSIVGPVPGSNRRRRSARSRAESAASSSVASVHHRQDSESDYSDTISVVSDVSDLSMMSYTNCDSRSSHQSFNHVFERMPKVHGRKELDKQVQIRKLTNKLEVALAERSEFEKKVNQEFSHKKEADALKAMNFNLQRENANLKSQVKSLQALCETLSQRSEHSETRIVEVGEEIVKHLQQELQESRAKAIELNSEKTALGLMIKRRDEELAVLKDQHSSVVSTSQELSLANQSMKTRVQELEAEVRHAVSCKVAAEHGFQVMTGERESVTKSKDWYRDQLKQTQESRTQAQKELMVAQKENAEYKSAIELLKSEVAALKNAAEADKEKALKEKEMLKQQLEDIEMDIKDKAVVVEAVDQMENQELQAKLKLYDDENHRLVERIRQYEVLHVEYGKLYALHEEKEETIRKLQQELSSKAGLYEITERKLELTMIDFGKMEDKLRLTEFDTDDYRKKIKEKNELLSEMKRYKIDTELTISKMKREKLLLEGTVKQLRDDVSKAAKNFDDSCKEVSLKEKAIESLRREKEELEERIRRYERHEDDSNDIKQDNIDLRKQLLELETLQYELDDQKQRSNDLRYELDSVHSEKDKVQTYEQIVLTQETELVEMKRILQERDSLIQSISSDITNIVKFISPDTEIREDVPLEIQMNELDELVRGLGDRDRHVDELGIVLDERNEAIDKLNKELEILRESSEKFRNEIVQERFQNSVSLVDEINAKTKDIEIFKSRVRDAEEQWESSMVKVHQLQDQVSRLEQELELTRNHLYETNNEKAKMKKKIDDNLLHDEQLRHIQDEKIGRLELDLENQKRECESFGARIKNYENQILELELKNGTLVADSQQCNTLKQQIKRLREDAARNTASNKEMIQILKEAKASLCTQVASLEKSILEEKEVAAKYKNELLEAMHENSALKKELKSHKIGLEAANMSIDKLKKDKEKRDQRLDEICAKAGTAQGELERLKDLILTKDDVINQLKAAVEEEKAKQSLIEDQLKQSNYNLHKKNIELDSSSKFVKLTKDNYEAEVMKLERANETLRQEISACKANVDTLIEEKRQYQTQVQDMNRIVRSCIDHMRALRSRPPSGEGSSPEAPPPATPSPPPPPFDEKEFQELLKRVTAPLPSRNLSSIHKCLDLIKSEMVVLQRQLRNGEGKPRKIEKAASVDGVVEHREAEQ